MSAMIIIFHYYSYSFFKLSLNRLYSQVHFLNNVDIG